MAISTSSHNFTEESPAFDRGQVEEAFSLDTLRSILSPLTATDLLKVLSVANSVNAAFESFRADNQRRDASQLRVQDAVYDLHEALRVSGLSSRQIPAPEDAYSHLLSSMRNRSREEGWYDGANTLDERIGRTLAHFNEPGVAEVRGYIGDLVLESVHDYPNHYFVTE